MPKRTCDDFRSIYRLCAAIDGLAPDATSWQVAARCASAMADALEAHAVVIHQHDALRRQLRTIGVHGPNAGDLLGTTTSADDDFVVTAVLTNKRPLMLRLDGALPRFVPDRHRLLGASRSLAGFAVIRAGGCVGLIEIVSVAEERQHAVNDACELVAQRLLAAFDAHPNRGHGKSDAAPFQQRPAAPLWSSSECDPTVLVSRSSDEPRTVATPATFPKSAPTLVCRLKR